jgi:glyoxylase-like metal-dependent hydrolase (beta-lactamase superfamily II)
MTMEAARARYPGKPVRYLVMTHPHIDHTSGAREYAAAGAQVYVGHGNGAYFEQMFNAPHQVRKDQLALTPRKVKVTEVADKQTLTDGERKVELYRIATTHANGMLICYVPHAKIGWVVDIWSPVRDPIGPTQGQRELYQAVVKAGIAPERFAGGHGGVGAYKELADKAAAAR